MQRRSLSVRWSVTYWLLMVSLVITAILNMRHVRAGFATNYLADLTVPALLYVICRGLAPGTRRRTPLRAVLDAVGRTPERAAWTLFVASTATELVQLYWPGQFIAGRYDPWDIVAYASGLAACYVAELWERAHHAEP